MVQYVCESCNYTTDHKYNYERHCETLKHLQIEKEKKHYACKSCGYSTKNKSQYELHLHSQKHQKNSSKDEYDY